jgi:hypothetical protein
MDVTLQSKDTDCLTGSKRKIHNTTVVHTYNPRNFWSWDQKDHGLRSSGLIVQRPHHQNSQSKTTCRCGSSGWVPACKCKALSSNPSPIKEQQQQKKQDLTICCLQEIHLTINDTHKLKVKGWKKIHQPCRNRKSKQQ